MKQVSEFRLDRNSAVIAQEPLRFDIPTYDIRHIDRKFNRFEEK